MGFLSAWPWSPAPAVTWSSALLRTSPLVLCQHPPPVPSADGHSPSQPPLLPPALASPEYPFLPLTPRPEAELATSSPTLGPLAFLPSFHLPLPHTALQSSDRAHYFSSSQSVYSRKRRHRLCLYFLLMPPSIVVWFLLATVLKKFSPEASQPPMPWPPVVFIFLISPWGLVSWSLLPWLSGLPLRACSATHLAPSPQALPHSVYSSFLC